MMAHCIVCGGSTVDGTGGPCSMGCLKTAQRATIAMTQPVSPDKPAGEALPFGIDDEQNIAAKVKICRTPPPSVLDEEVVAVLGALLTAYEMGGASPGDDGALKRADARALIARLKDRRTN